MSIYLPCPQNDKAIHRSFIHNCPQVRAHRMCVNRNDWQTVTQAYNEVPLSNEKEQTDPPTTQRKPRNAVWMKEARHESFLGRVQFHSQEQLELARGGRNSDSLRVGGSTRKGLEIIFQGDRMFYVLISVTVYRFVKNHWQRFTHFLAYGLHFN